MERIYSPTLGEHEWRLLDSILNLKNQPSALFSDHSSVTNPAVDKEAVALAKPFQIENTGVSEPPSKLATINGSDPV